MHLKRSESVLSLGCVGSFVSGHGSAQFGLVFVMCVLDFLHFLSSLSLWSSWQVGSAVSGMCLARVWSVVLMSVLDFVHSGRSLPLRSRSADAGALLGRFHTCIAVQVFDVGA